VAKKVVKARLPRRRLQKNLLGAKAVKGCCKGYTAVKAVEENRQVAGAIRICPLKAQQAFKKLHLKTESAIARGPAPDRRLYWFFHFQDNAA
jgi:hypothetical protein